MKGNANNKSWEYYAGAKDGELIVTPMLYELIEVCNREL